MIRLDTLVMRSDPYPVGSAIPAFDEAFYDALLNDWPDERLHKHLLGAYNKFSLSEKNNPAIYASFIASSVLWKTFHSYVKGRQFIDQVFDALAHCSVYPQLGTHARFEFSSLPASGGCIMPHTDIPSKVVTIVIPMVRSGWDTSWGGGTDILEPYDPSTRLVDYRAPLKAFKRVATFDYAPNRAVVFVKTANSWHSVGPLKGPVGVMRRTLTINIERAV